MGGYLMPSVALRPQDLLVEYRDKSLVRKGSIPIEDLRLKMQPVFNGVGSWLVQLPAEHRAVPYLRAPGAGIVVTNLRTGVTLMSGSSSKPSKKTSMVDPKGMVTVAGLTDDRLLWDALAYPQPDNSNPATQTLANDVRTANGESLIRAYVALNIANGAIALPAPIAWAPAGRRGGLRNFLRLQAVNSGLGSSTTRRPRFDILGDLINGIALETGIGFRIVQVGSVLELQVYQPVDRQATIRLDVLNGTLQEQEIEFAPPEVTRMIVAGQGEGAARQMVSVTSAAATSAEADWGLIIEEFKDQRNTNVTTELTAAGVERLNEAGFTKVALKAIPSNDQTMIFLTDFFMGDRVQVVVDGQEQPNSIITEAAIVVDSNGIKTAVAIGDVADFDSDSALRQTLTDTQRRVDNLERNAEAAPTTASDYAMPGEIKIWPGASIPAGWFIVNGQAVSRAGNPRLLAAIGLVYGAGDGTTTFNVPNYRGRAVIGLDSVQTEFDVMGETGGTKTHTLTVAETPPHKHPMTMSASAGTSSNRFAQGNAPTSLIAETDIGSTGGGGAHNNLSPYIVAHYIIRGS